MFPVEGPEYGGSFVKSFVLCITSVNNCSPSLLPAGCLLLLSSSIADAYAHLAKPLHPNSPSLAWFVTPSASWVLIFMVSTILAGVTSHKQPMPDRYNKMPHWGSTSLLISLATLCQTFIQTATATATATLIARVTAIVQDQHCPNQKVPPVYEGCLNLGS